MANLAIVNPSSVSFRTCAPHSLSITRRHGARQWLPQQAALTTRTHAPS
jgi:hypothetical protein